MDYVALLKAGDEPAFRRLYREHASALRFFASKYISDLQAIDDIVQDAFISLWENRTTMPENGSIRAYLYSSVRFACMNNLRHSRVKARFATNYIEEHDETFLDNVQEAEIFRALLAVFEELPPACKEVYTLSLGGMSHDEIARKLGITVNTVKKHKNNANRFLRERMKNMISLLVIMQYLSAAGTLYAGGDMLPDSIEKYLSTRPDSAQRTCPMMCTPKSRCPNLGVRIMRARLSRYADINFKPIFCGGAVSGRGIAESIPPECPP